MSSGSGVMTIEEIREAIPHRYPFLLLDRVLEKSPTNSETRKGQKVKCLKNVTINEPFFQGHFPDFALMPGVLLVEAIAQAGAIACFRKGEPALDVAIATIKETRIHRPVVPGDQLIVECEVVKDRRSMVVIQGKITVDDHVITETSILATVIPSQKS